MGESNTGSCRTHTPFSTTASIEQPTEQCVQTVRLTSTLRGSSAAFALPIMLYGSCVAKAAPPATRPERFRNDRRSSVPALPSARDRRDDGRADTAPPEVL